MAIHLQNGHYQSIALQILIAGEFNELLVGVVQFKVVEEVREIVAEYDFCLVDELIFSLFCLLIL